MKSTPQQHRDQFRDEGYTVFKDVLPAPDIACAIAAIDRLITPQTMPPIVSGDANPRNGRKQLSPDQCDPALARLGTHPRALEAAAVLVGPRFRLARTPTPCVTFKSPPGGERFDWGYHVDWSNRPPKPGDDAGINGMLHLSRVEPGGGAFMLIPGSHRVVERTFGDPVLSQRAYDQKFKDFPGMGSPVEMCIPAGSLLFYHPFLVHDRSENIRDQPRKIVFVGYRPWAPGEFEKRDTAKLKESFHAQHLAAMDARERAACGLE